MSTSFSNSISSNNRGPCAASSQFTSESTDLDCSSFNINDTLASILRGCEPTGNVSRTQTVPSASQDRYNTYQILLTTESSSNGNLKTSSDNNTVSAIRTCNLPNKKCKKKRIAVPLEKKDDKYWERRRRNNLAAKRCRESKRQMELRELQMADKCIQENGKLRAEISAYRLEIDTLRRLLRDANTTLALWVQQKHRNGCHPM